MDFSSLCLRLSGYVVTTLVTIVIAMGGFWLMEGRKYITRDEASKMISSENRIIRQILEEQQEDKRNLVRILEKNTEAIQQLRIQMATLNSTLKYIEEQNKNRHDHPNKN